MSFTGVILYSYRRPFCQAPSVEAAVLPMPLGKHQMVPLLIYQLRQLAVLETEILWSPICHKEVSENCVYTVVVVFLIESSRDCCQLSHFIHVYPKLFTAFRELAAQWAFHYRFISLA